jgi:hypothetical protein
LNFDFNLNTLSKKTVFEMSTRNSVQSGLKIRGLHPLALENSDLPSLLIDNADCSANGKVSGGFDKKLITSSMSCVELVATNCATPT